MSEQPIEPAIQEKFDQLEEKLAYLEMSNVELNDEIFRQQQDIDSLTKAHRSLLERLETLQDSAAEGDLQQGERPPHY
ncbi:MAG: SlyX family protein [Porticoccaceae bacterium]|nr:SlyX family protein [Porticoccaceae bacterium]